MAPELVNHNAHLAINATKPDKGETKSSVSAPVANEDVRAGLPAHNGTGLKQFQVAMTATSKGTPTASHEPVEPVSSDASKATDFAANDKVPESGKGADKR
ncbi:hypothetical protein HDE_06802 [Halotydeus destructor]|nr:hypothetical protein HDE_06802 [Halotydeus destructor]